MLFKIFAGLVHDLHNKFQFITMITGIFMFFTIIVSRCLVIALSGKNLFAVWSRENICFSLTTSFFWLVGFVLNSGTAHLMTSLME